MKGLPQSFKLNVAPPRRPALNLGDYLHASVPTRAAPTPGADPQPQKSREPAARSRPRSERTPEIRMQLNLRAETQRHLEELVGYIRSFGPQRDTKSSEILETLIEIAFASRRQLDFSDVPTRGPWGSARAASFRNALRDAITDAIQRSRR